MLPFISLYFLLFPGIGTFQRVMIGRNKKISLRPDSRGGLWAERFRRLPTDPLLARCSGGPSQPDRSLLAAVGNDSGIDQPILDQAHFVRFFSLAGVQGAGSTFGERQARPEVSINRNYTQGSSDRQAFVRGNRNGVAENRGLPIAWRRREGRDQGSRENGCG